MTSQQLAERFKDSLLAFESHRKLDALAPLFSSSCQLASIAFDEPLQGEPLKDFWADYGELFDHVKTEFTGTHALGSVAVLEWRSTGKLKGGHDVRYCGVTILEFANDSIERFRTYYDSAAFLPDGHERLGRKPRS
jgi:hypothetical protein